MAEELDITPEWYSKILREKQPLSPDMRLRLADLLRRKKLNPASIDESGGGRPSFLLHKDDGPPPMVASRISSAPGAPSTRADCEVYFAELLDAAERSGNPNAFPVIHDRLQKKFELTEWKVKNENTD